MKVHSKIYLVLLLLSLAQALIFVAKGELLIGVTFILFSALTMVFYRFSHMLDVEKKYQDMDKLYQDIDDASSKKAFGLSVPLALVGLKGDVLWFNQQFEQSFLEERNPDVPLKDLLRKELELDLDLVLVGKTCETSYNDHHYIVEASNISESDQDMVLLHFFDVTSQKEYQDIYKQNEPVFAYLTIDNYDDIIEQLPPHERATVLSKIDVQLNEWAKALDALIIEYEKDHYIMVFEKFKLADLERDQFKILDEIRSIDAGEKAQVTMSIGIGVSEEVTGISKSNDLSYAALDIALARGGDQAVVRKDEAMFFYGGKTEATERRTKVKARVKAHGLRELIREADNVLIMGHKIPDMDCIGAGMGLVGACHALETPVWYVLEAVNYSIDMMLQYIVETDTYENIFVVPEVAEEHIGRNTLLIVVDTQNIELLAAPHLAEIANKVVVIDHHRRSGTTIPQTVLNYAEPYASSTSELVTELLQYFDDKDILNETEANALLAGICMDTKMFTTKTGVRTFEAASYLKRQGADTQIAKVLLQDDLDTYLRRCKVIEKAEVLHKRIAVTAFEDNGVSGRVVAAQAADELINIKDIQASFVLLKSEGVIKISARSNGEVNVQLILEKLGGGGHLTMAGAQLDDISDLDEARTLILNAIDDFIKEEKEAAQAKEKAKGENDK